MTSSDTPPGGEPDASSRRVQSDGNYVAYETDDGAFVIRDESEPDAWIRSDTVVALESDVV